jgi:hypothetical protein
MLRWINIYASCAGVAGFGAGMMLSELIRGVGFIGSIPMGIGFSLVILGYGGVIKARIVLKEKREESVNPQPPTRGTPSESN